MENYAPLVTLVIVFPIIGLLINLFLGKYMNERLIGTVGSLAAGLAFTVAVILLTALPRYGYEAVVVNPPLISQWITIPAAALQIPLQFRVDTLSVTMMLVVTGVGTLIHIYAIGYMHGDPRFQRFFVYLNLFLMFMLILVTGNNFLMMFIGWEGVGLCSFLLIGFWFDKTKGEGWRNSNAARKAMIVNRVGDFGILMAVFFIFWTFGTLDYYKPGEVLEVGSAAVAEAKPAGEATTGEKAVPTEPAKAGEQTAVSAQKGVFAQAEEWLKAGGHKVHFGPFELPLETVITLITLFMLLGVTGKSAQIPLFVWLPDAMAGPTPVSALIHAATMVTAGIYLICRSSVLYHAAPISAAAVTIIGSTTALMAGFVALGQWDIKRVLAYSTVSQLGFMVAAAGLGGYAAAMFHLVTHAFFKALLFLGSGSVIHAMEHGHHHAHAHGDHEESHDAHAAHDAHDEHAEHGEHEEEKPFDPQDMRNMGGLARRMPVTFWTYMIGTLALAGIFPLAGFWSKDEILGKAFSALVNDGRVEGGYALAFLLGAAGFTAFYMWRQIRMVFLGKPRTEAAEHAPESSPLMTTPLAVLAVLSLFGGLLSIPAGVSISNVILVVVAAVLILLALIGAQRARANLGSVTPVVVAVTLLVLFILALLPTLNATWSLESLGLWLEHAVPYVTGLAFNLPLAAIALGVAVVAIVLADRIYANPLTKKGRDRLEIRAGTRQAFQLANARLYWDEIYGMVIEQPFNRASKWLANTLDWEFWHNRFHEGVFRDSFNRFSKVLSNPVDRGAIDAGFMSLGRFVTVISARLRKIQTGYVRTYVFTMLLGVLLVIVIILFPLFRQLLGQ